MFKDHLGTVDKIFSNCQPMIPKDVDKLIKLIRIDCDKMWEYLAYLKKNDRDKNGK